MLAIQKKTVGLNQGAIPGKTGSKAEPVLDPRPTLSDAGIDRKAFKSPSRDELVSFAAPEPSKGGRGKTSDNISSFGNAAPYLAARFAAFFRASHSRARIKVC